MKNIINESKKHYVVVNIKGIYLTEFIRTLFKLKIDIENINYLGNEEINIKILKSNYQKIKKKFKNLKIKKVTNIGIHQIKPFLKKNSILLSCLIIGVFLIFLLTRVVIRVDVIHSKKDIRELVRGELENFGIKRLTFRKSYLELQEIKKSILDKYPNRLEWLEFEIEGMNIRVRIEERIITKDKEERGACHIVAKKDAIISKIIAYAGETTKRIDNFVKKGDILISGSIMLYEEIKGTICAKGEVYGEVWYTVDVSVPLNYEEYIMTNRKRNNFSYETQKGKQRILRERFKNYTVSNKYLFSMGNIRFFFSKEREYKVISKTYSETEAITKGIELATEKMEIKLGKNDTILLKKILKKTLNNSTMDLSIFFSVNELVSETSEFTPIGEESE